MKRVGKDHFNDNWGLSCVENYLLAAIRANGDSPGLLYHKSHVPFDVIYRAMIEEQAAGAPDNPNYWRNRMSQAKEKGPANYMTGSLSAETSWLSLDIRVEYQALYPSRTQLSSSGRLLQCIPIRSREAHATNVIQPNGRVRALRSHLRCQALL